MVGSSLGSRARSRLWLWLALLALVIVVSWARVVVVNTLDDQGHFSKYTYYANEIAAGHVPVERLGDLSPGYLWSLALMMGPLGLQFAGLRVLQILSGTLVALLCAVAAYRLGGWRAAAVTALAVFGSRALLVNATEAEPESLIVLLNSGALCALLCSTRPRWQLVAGLLFGLSAVTRPTALPAAAVAAVWLWWVRRHPSGTTELAPQRRAVPWAYMAGLILPLLILQVAYSGVPGSRFTMNPGTVFYEGSNPNSTGLVGDAPLVVKEIEPSYGVPDALHLAYRDVALAALNRAAGQAASNSYWSARAKSFIAAHPTHWLLLELSKLHHLASSPEVWDLSTMEHKDRELARWLWWPFGLLVSLSTIVLLYSSRGRGSVLLGAYAATYVLAMLTFYVSSRQRLPLLPALAILSALGVASVCEGWQRGDRTRAACTLVLGLVVAALLAIPSVAQREDTHEWKRAFEAHHVRRLMQKDITPAQRLLLEGELAVYTELPIPAAVAASAHSALTRALRSELDPADRFDMALAAERVGDWRLAERLLDQLEDSGYRPVRGAVVCSSVSYQLARCRLRRGTVTGLSGLLERARSEAPGHAAVLALSAVVARRGGDREADLEYTRELSVLHDPFTARLYTARAAADSGDLERARQMLQSLDEDLPQWPRPKLLLDSAEVSPCSSFEP